MGNSWIAGPSTVKPIEIHFSHATEGTVIYFKGNTGPDRNGTKTSPEGRRFGLRVLAPWTAAACCRFRPAALLRTACRWQQAAPSAKRQQGCRSPRRSALGSSQTGLILVPFGPDSLLKYPFASHSERSDAAGEGGAARSRGTPSNNEPLPKQANDLDGGFSTGC